MSQIIESPCIQVCTIDPVTRWCMGCQRTLPEIAQWSAMGAYRRAAVMADLPRRHEAMDARAIIPGSTTRRTPDP